MKKRTVIIAVLLVAIIGFASSFAAELLRTTSKEDTVIVTIPKGSSEKAIAKILKKNGVINFETTFRLKMKKSPYRGKLNYGKYILNKKMCLDDIIDSLRQTSVYKEGIKLTIPEGYSAQMIAARCEKIGLVNAEDFLKELKQGSFDYNFIRDIPDRNGVKYKLQGYLFPSTYLFGQEVDAHTVIDTMLGEFEKQYYKIKGMLPENMSMNDAIIRASLIEREAKLANERSKISGVIQNRIDSGIKLQIDATVVYVITDGMYDVNKVLYKDLKIDSPYNTYKYSGLPIGAICNPGIESIKAAMKPDKHKYLYYHTDNDKNDGSHIFSETFAQHVK